MSNNAATNKRLSATDYWLSSRSASLWSTTWNFDCFIKMLQKQQFKWMPTGISCDNKTCHCCWFFGGFLVLFLFIFGTLVTFRLLFGFMSSSRIMWSAAYSTHIHKYTHIKTRKIRYCFLQNRPLWYNLKVHVLHSNCCNCVFVSGKVFVFNLSLNIVSHQKTHLLLFGECLFGRM